MIQLTGPCRDSISDHVEPVDVEQCCDLRREIDQTTCEDDRDNAGSIDLQRKI